MSDRPHGVPYRQPRDLTEAAAIQRELAALVVRTDRFGPIRTVAGVDVGFPRALQGEAFGAAVAAASSRAEARTALSRPALARERVVARAAIVVVTFPSLDPIAREVADVPVVMPYQPGFLAFRDLPAVLAAYERLSLVPDLLLVDGQGIMHPRRLGIASHLGVVVDRPTIGVAKSRLVGWGPEPGPEPGAYTLLRDGGEVVGAALRTRRGARPVYVSIGHRVSLESAVRLVLACCRGQRLPEPIRLAHQAAGQAGP